MYIDSHTALEFPYRLRKYSICIKNIKTSLQSVQKHVTKGNFSLSWQLPVT